MSVIRFKSDDVEIKNWSEALHWIFHCLRTIALMPGMDTPSEIVITSINDGVHVKNSRHYTDEAIDLRAKNFDTLQAKDNFRMRLNALLNSHPDDPNKFIILHEYLGAPNEHFHVQVRKGLSFQGSLRF